MAFKKGQFIEIGYGEPFYNEDDELEVEDGGSYYTVVDIDNITEEEIEKMVSDNVMYIIVIDENDHDSIRWAKENPPLSKMFK